MSGGEGGVSPAFGEHMGQEGRVLRKGPRVLTDSDSLFAGDFASLTRWPLPQGSCSRKGNSARSSLWTG